jgi:predicted transcriptional regulator
VSANPHVEVEKPSAAQIRKSVRDDGSVSFVDGRTYKPFKCHLSANGLDPRSYPARYSLPADDRMIAPSYTEQRSAIAEAIGLRQPGAMARRERKGRKAARTASSYWALRVERQ